MCWAPRIIGWSYVTLVGALPTGADVNSDGNSLNHMDGPFSDAIGLSCSPVPGGEMAVIAVAGDAQVPVPTHASRAARAGVITRSSPA